MHTAEIVLALLVLATLVAAFAERLRLPAPSLLVLAGLGVGLLPGVPDVHIAPELVSLVVLPPLLYAAAVDVVVTDLRAVLAPVLVLSIGLVAATAVAVALVLHALTPVGFLPSLVLGAVLASTDPVAVSALARRLQLPPRLLALVQGESLLNDATSLLLFRVVVAGVVAGHLAGPVMFPLKFLGLGAGGAAVGIACGFVVRQLHQRTDDTVIAAVISLLTPYAVFVAAEVAHTSGVTAVVFGGLYLGRRRYQMSRGPARLQIGHLYGVVVFLLESVVFAIIGLQLPTLVRALTSGEHDFVLVALAVTGTLLVVRVAWVWAASYLPGELEQRRSRVVAVTSWAGTRGVVPLAAALSIPLTGHAGAPFPHRALLLVLATGCTALTLVIQGLTLGPVVSRTGVVDDPATRDRERALARHAALSAAMNRLDELREREEASPAAVEWLRGEFAARLERASEGLAATEATSESPRATRDEMQALRRELIAVQSARLHDLVNAGRISEPVRRQVQRLLDLDEARSSD
ncbi:MAG TPA: Na+/H+ antiporter [Mycobacteriales bacterium]|nr:Na+/H+ antiporter [Mycobacteriales bacterium]